MAALSFPVLVWVTTLYHIPSHLSAGKSAGKQQAGRGSPSVRPVCRMSSRRAGLPGFSTRRPAAPSAPPACGYRHPKGPHHPLGMEKPAGCALRPAGRRTGRRIPGPHKQHRVRWYPQRALHPSIRFVVAWGFSASKNLLVKAPQQPQPGQKRLSSLPPGI